MKRLKYFSVLEIEVRKEVQKESVLLAAEEIFNHAHKSVVRLIARQKIDDPSMLMLHCVRRDRVGSRLAELDNLGYSIGPDTSREFCLSDGQKLLVKCKGNIGMTTRSKKSVLSYLYIELIKFQSTEMILICYSFPCLLYIIFGLLIILATLGPNPLEPAKKDLKRNKQINDKELNIPENFWFK